MDNWKKQLKKRWKESAIFHRKIPKSILDGQNSKKLLYPEQTLSVDQLADLFPLARIDTNEVLSSKGISQDEARLRLVDKRLQRRSRRMRAALRFLRQCVLSAFPLLLLCSTLMCLALALIDRSSAQNSLQMALFQGVILAFVCVIGAFERSRLRRLKNVFHRGDGQPYFVVREGVRLAVDQRDILTGDLLWVEVGQRVPVDLRILWVNSEFRATTNWLTGRTEAMRFTAQTSPRHATGDFFTMRNILCAHFTCTGGRCLGLVLRTGKNTLFARLLCLNTFLPSPLLEGSPNGGACQRGGCQSALRLSYLSLVRSIVWLSLGASTAALLLSLLFTHFARPFHAFLHVFLLFLIASVPQALPLTLSAQLLLVARRLRQKCDGMLLRQGAVADALGRTSVLMVHSSSFLSSNCPTVSDLWLAGQNKTTNAQKLAGDGKIPRERAMDELLRTVELSMKMGGGQQNKSDEKGLDFGRDVDEQCARDDRSTELALAKFLCQIHPPVGPSLGLHPVQKHECPEGILQSIERHPSLQLVVAKWDSSTNNSNDGSNNGTVTSCTQRSGTAESQRQRYRLIVRGPAEEVIKMCTTVGGAGRKGRLCEPIDDQHLAQFEDAFLALSTQVKSCVGFAILDLFDDDIDLPPVFHCESFSECSFSIGSSSNGGWSFLGMLALANPPEAKCSAQLAELASSGVWLVLFTDQHPIVAEAMAGQLGFTEGEGPKTEESVKVNAVQIPLELQFDSCGPTVGLKTLYKNSSFSSSSGYHSSERGDIENLTENGDKKEATDSDNCDFIKAVLAKMMVGGFPRHSLCPQFVLAQVLSLIKQLQLHGHSVTFVGDNLLTDAPALLLADVGIARDNDSSLLQEASDVLCVNFGLGSLLRAIVECQLLTANLASALAFSLSFTMPALLPVLLSFLLPLPHRMTPLHTLFATLLVQIPPAIAMAFQWPHLIGPPFIKTQIPLKRPLVPRGLLLYVYLLVSPLFALGALLAYFTVFWHSGIDLWTGQIVWNGIWNEPSTNVSIGVSSLAQQTQVLGQSRAAWLLTLVLSQLTHSWICVGFLRRKWEGGKIFLNWPLWTAIVLELSLLFLVIYLPGLNSFLGIASPPLWVWLFPVGTVIALLIMITFLKGAIHILRQRLSKRCTNRMKSLFDW